MNMDHNKADAAADAALHTAMKSWQVPPPSPWLQTRATQNIIAQVKASRTSPWPLAPLRLGSAVGVCMVVGILVGANVPAADVASDTETAEVVYDTDISAANTADDVDMIALLW